MIALKIYKKKMQQDQPKPEGGRVYKPPVVVQIHPCPNMMQTNLHSTCPPKPA